MPAVLRLFVLSALALSLAGPAAAEETLRCPDLSAAKKVGACPSNAELRHTFKRLCVDQEPDYQGTNALFCASFEEYAAEKYKALFDVAAPQGAFEGYLSCAKPVPEAGAAPHRVTVECATKGCEVTCAYEDDRFLSLHTDKRCHLPGETPSLGLSETDCGGDAGACVVRCE